MWLPVNARKNHQFRFAKNRHHVSRVKPLATLRCINRIMRLKDPMSCNDVSMPLDGLIMQSFCIVKLTEIFLIVVALLSYGERTFARENFFLFRKGKTKLSKHGENAWEIINQHNLNGLQRHLVLWLWIFFTLTSLTQSQPTSRKLSKCWNPFGLMFGKDMTWMNKPTNAAWGEATYSLHCSPRTWPQLEIADLIKNVQKLPSSSAGLDGWSGTELSYLYVYWHA